MDINIPELNPEMVSIKSCREQNFPINVFLTLFYDAQDVYRIGTLMELVRTIALSFADDGKRVKVFCQLMV